MCGEENNILYWADYSAAKAGKSSIVPDIMYWHDEPNEPIKEGPLSYTVCTPGVLICLSFNFQQAAGATPLWSLWTNPPIIFAVLVEYDSFLAESRMKNWGSSSTGEILVKHL